MTDVVLQITAQDGTQITLDDRESPQSISWGGRQMFAQSDLVGGGRTIDALGESHDPLTWNGILFGVNASQRAKYLDNLRRAGQAVEISWDDYLYSALLVEFKPMYMQSWHVRYSITFVVIEDLTQRATSAVQESLVQLLNNDAATSTCLGEIIGDSELNSLMSDVNEALQAYGNAVDAITAPIAVAGQCVAEVTQGTQALLTSLVAPIAAAQARIETLQTQVGEATTLFQNTASAATSGALPSSIAAIASANVGMGTAQPLYAMSANLGRMQANIKAGSPATTNTQMEVVGGNLQNIAAQVYGDATLWPKIASANGLLDPVLPSTPMTLQIPARATI